MIEFRFLSPDGGWPERGSQTKQFYPSSTTATLESGCDLRSNDDCYVLAVRSRSQLRFVILRDFLIAEHMNSIPFRRARDARCP